MGLFIGSSVHILRAIARQSPSSSRGAAVEGWSKPRRGGARKNGRRSPQHVQRGCAARVRPTCFTPRSRRDFQRQGRRSFPKSGYRTLEMRLMTPPTLWRAS